MFVCVFPFYLFKQICIICWIKYIQYVAHSLAQRHIHSYFIDKPILFAIKCNVLFYEFCMLYVVCIKMYIIVGFEVDKCGFSKIKLLHAWCSCVYLRAFLASNKFQTSFFLFSDALLEKQYSNWTQILVFYRNVHLHTWWWKMFFKKKKKNFPIF